MTLVPQTGRAGAEGGLQCGRSTNVYATGITTKLKTVDEMRPPMIAIAIGARNSDPAPKPTAIGNIPRIAANVFSS